MAGILLQKMSYGANISNHHAISAPSGKQPNQCFVTGHLSTSLCKILMNILDGTDRTKQYAPQLFMVHSILEPNIDVSASEMKPSIICKSGLTKACIRSQKAALQ